MSMNFHMHTFLQEQESAITFLQEIRRTELPHFLHVER